MNWKVQNDTQRGYNFHYDDLSRITAADYQNNDANTGKNYSTTYVYDNMGNMKNLRRYGLSAKPSIFGIIDDLALSYNGNQLSSVTDASTGEPLYSGAFNFVKDTLKTTEYTYDANGNLTRDSHKKIAKIQYNILNLPSALQFTEGHTSEYLYDAAGVKRRVKQVTTTENLLVPMGSMLPVPADKVAVTTQTDYCGNVIYENGILNKILVDEGYITMNGTTPTYHYYIQDHQRNNRVVFNQSGTVEQTNHYYPFGMTFGEEIDNSDNRYKYNDKELDRMHGLDLYDYGARMQDGMRFTTIDPLAEKYYSISPYAYCAGNPMNRIDLNGDSVTVLNLGTGKNQHMAILIQNKNGKWQYYSVNGDNEYFSGKFTGGRESDDLAVGEFNSPQEFMNSYYNQKGDETDNTKNSYGYSEGFIIPTSKKQDKVIKEKFIDISKNEEYSLNPLAPNHCATTVQRSLNQANIETREAEIRMVTDRQHGEIYEVKTKRNPYLPSNAFKAIIKNNPNGKYIRKTK
ncbi:RHS repeat-associated core domain-containing protein [uncultured Bacteroides sp.]|uniref:RHS repeat domain-containing protein n=1 Tax=uncultured Bacteroides sp. TaxID=162156 RepID=UPI002AAA853A|nr:RHS repeat-associated core domain-containing protein [uncultured Bacteroides sp.]